MAALGAFQSSLFEKCAEGSDACAGTDHDDVLRIVLGQPEGAGFLDVNRNISFAQFGMISEPAGTQSFFLPTMGFVPDHGDAQVRLVWMSIYGGGERVETWNNR